VTGGGDGSLLIYEVKVSGLVIPSHICLAWPFSRRRRNGRGILARSLAYSRLTGGVGEIQA
jgi:hypothetical protein